MFDLLESNAITLQELVFFSIEGFRKAANMCSVPDFIFDQIAQTVRKNPALLKDAMEGD